MNSTFLRMPAMSSSENKKNTLNIPFEHRKEFRKTQENHLNPLTTPAQQKKMVKEGRLIKRFAFCLFRDVRGKRGCFCMNMRDNVSLRDDVKMLKQSIKKTLHILSLMLRVLQPSPRTSSRFKKQAAGTNPVDPKCLKNCDYLAYMCW